MPSRRARLRPVRLSVFASLAMVGLVLVPATSQATPVPAAASAVAPTAAEAKKQHAALRHKMEQATEEYNMANVLLARSQKAAKVLTAQASAQQAKVKIFETEVAEFAASAYRGGRVDMVTSLLESGSPQNFLDQMSTLDNLSRTQRAQLDRLIAAKRTLDQQKAKIAAAMKSQRENQQTIKTRRAAIEKDLKAWKALDEKLNPRPANSGNYGGTYTGPATGNARVALQAAYDQMGKPYRWGGAGPNSFDCSGLTMWAWGKAGVSLPHSSRMQYSGGRKVARDSLQPGDLVFFGSPISHVAIFVSGDTAIGAPTTGDVVRYQSISRMGKPYAGATRP